MDPRDGDNRQAQLDRAIGPVVEVLEAGEDVLLHCNQSFHRSPVVGAAVCARTIGVSATVQGMNKPWNRFAFVFYCSYSVRLGGPFNGFRSRLVF